MDLNLWNVKHNNWIISFYIKRNILTSKNSFEGAFFLFWSWSRSLIMILITAFLNTDHELDQRIKLSLHESWSFLITDGGQYILYNYLKIIKSKICPGHVFFTWRAMLMIPKCGSPNLGAIFSYIHCTCNNNAGL